MQSTAAAADPEVGRAARLVRRHRTSAHLALCTIVLMAALAALAAVVGSAAPPAAAAAPGAAAAPAAAAAPGAGSTGSTGSATAQWAPVYNRDFPDPDILAYGGTYYAYSTEVVETAVPAAQSTDALSWQTVPGGALPELPPWAIRGGTWAPSVARSSTGQFVMYYTAEDVDLGVECIGMATSLTPTGPFVDTSLQPVLCDPSLGGDIDPDVFTDPSGQSYLIVKNDGNRIGSTSSLWSIPLDGNLAMSGSPKLLLSDDQRWQEGIIEAPDMVDVSGTYYLFYGGGSYQTSEYSIGFATCAGPLGPCADSPSNPVLTSQPGLVGPGGPSIFTTSSGQLMMALAGWRGAIGYPQGYRPMYMASLTFQNGLPTFAPANVAPPAGYWEVAADGGVFSFGVPFHGSVGGQVLNAPIVGTVATPDGGGYWQVASDGGVFAYGDAKYYGSMGGRPLNAPIVGMAATLDGGGYWLVASDGGIFAFGDAAFYGSMGGLPLNKPVVGIAADPDSDGYWEVASDGGIFAFGATFEGSTGSMVLNEPVVGMAAAPNGNGYWFVASDGGVFAEGKGAQFYGSMGGKPLDKPIVGISTTSDGDGYRLVASDGGIFAFGDAGFYGSMGGQVLDQPIVGIAAGAG